MPTGLHHITSPEVQPRIYRTMWHHVIAMRTSSITHSWSQTTKGLVRFCNREHTGLVSPSLCCVRFTSLFPIQWFFKDRRFRPGARFQLPCSSQNWLFLCHSWNHKGHKLLRHKESYFLCNDSSKIFRFDNL